MEQTELDDPRIIFQDSGKWWFWDEVWVNAHGPYATEELAEEALKRYAKWLDEGDATTITR